MQVLLYILLFQQCGLQKGDDLLGGDIFIHDLGEHVIGDTEKQDDGGLVEKMILMEAVLVDQAQVAFGKCNILPQNPLTEFPFDYVGKFDVIMGVKLCFLTGGKGQPVTEGLGRRGEGSAQDGSCGGRIGVCTDRPA